MAITDFQKTQINNMNVASQRASLGTVIQDLQNAVTPEVTDLLAAVGDLTYTEQNYVTDDDSHTENIDALDIALKDANDTIGDLTYTEDNYVTDDASHTANIDALDIALKDVADILGGIVTGSYTAVADDETAGALTIASGLTSITGFVVSVIRGGTQIGGGWTPTTDAGNLTITDAAIVAGDVVHYIIF